MGVDGQQAGGDGHESHGAHMDGIYRYQRYIYDATRKYYLLGRDRMLDGLDPPERGTILEVGCGTGRNLILAAKRHGYALLLDQGQKLPPLIFISTFKYHFVDFRNGLKGD